MTRVSRVPSVRAWGPSTGPTACALAGRRCSLWGWRKGVPGGCAFHRGEWHLRSGAPPPPTARPLGGLLGSATHVLWARVCGCGGPTLSPWPACPVGAACRGGDGGPSPGGVACQRCEGRLASGAVPPPAARPLGQAAGVPRPVCPGCGRCGCGDPAPAQRRAPLPAGVARRGGGGRASPGGVPSAVVRGIWGQALRLPRLPAIWGRQPGFRDPCGPGAVGAGVGTQHQPQGARPGGPALRAVGVAEWASPGGVPSDNVRGVWGQALPLPRLPALWAGCRGSLPTCCGCGGVPAWGPVTNPTARALANWLCVLWGRHEGASCVAVGRLGSGPHPALTARPLGGLPGPTSHWLWVRGVAGVGTRHQPGSARSCVLWGRHEGARGGRLLPRCGASGVGRSPTPDCPPSGRPVRAQYPLAVGVGGCGRGDPSPTPQGALLRAGFARCGGSTRAPGAGASCLGVGRPGSGALPPPTAHPLGGLPGPTTHWLWVRGGAGVGTRHQPHSARSCVLWGRH